jgi:hypothetical protein
LSGDTLSSDSCSGKPSTLGSGARSHGPGLFGGARHLRHNVVPGPRLAQIEALAVFADPGEMAVAFNETGNRELPFQIDDLGIRTDPLGGVGIGPEAGDLVAAHGDGLRGGRRRVHGDDLPVSQHQVRRLRPRRRGANQNPDCTHVTRISRGTDHRLSQSACFGHA